jgi:hypothetical protein
MYWTFWEFLGIVSGKKELYPGKKNFQKYLVDLGTSLQENFSVRDRIWEFWEL